MNSKAVLLLSGGLDSYTCGAIAKEEGFDLYAISFDYGQRHAAELAAAKKVAAALRAAEHKILSLDLRVIGGSSLTDSIAVPKKNSADEIGVGIPSTYVPARNTIFLSLALGYAETRGAFDLFIGANAVDYSGYPDCRPAYLEAFEQMANLATKAGVEGRGHFKIHAPLLRMSKADIVRRGVALGLDYSLTHSCYDPSHAGPAGLACGRCDSCLLRKKGFAQAGVADPLRYA